MKRNLPRMILAAGALAAALSSLTVEANTTLFTAASGHKYRGYTVNRQPAAAQTVCLNAGGHLAVINDYNEWQDVKQNVAQQIPGAHFWLGMSLPANTSDPVTVTGEPYYNIPYFWNPQLFGGPQSYAQYVGVIGGSVQGWYTTSQKYYICEWDY